MRIMAVDYGDARTGIAMSDLLCGIVGSTTFFAEVGAVIADCIALYKYRGTEK